MRNFILRLFGLGHYISIIDEFDYQANQSENCSVMVYPAGEYTLNIHNGDDMEPISFKTPQERGAFAAGLAHAGEMMQAFSSTQEYEDEFVERMSELDKILLKKKPYGSA